LAYYKEQWDNIKDTNELRIRFLNSYNCGEFGYKRYIRKTGKISRAYDKKILTFRKNLINNKIISIDKTK
jgi:hypothetical protein